MPTMTENLWPTDFGKVVERTPVSILREQALGLGERTSNIVIGRVTSRPEPPEKFAHTLHLYSSPLGYSTELLTIYHGIDLYPVAIRVPGDPDLIDATNPEEFTASLKEIFSRGKIKKTIASLIAQSNE